MQTQKVKATSNHSSFKSRSIAPYGELATFKIRLGNWQHLKSDSALRRDLYIKYEFNATGLSRTK